MLHTTVVKLGGAVSTGPTFWRQVLQLSATRRIVIVHGGGAQSTRMAHRLNHIPKMVHGRRITGDIDLDIARWVMRGAVNLGLVSEALTHGIRPVGLSGVDGGMVRVTRRPPWTIDGEKIDFGWVGDIDKVCTDALTALMAGGFLPVIAPLGVDTLGQIYNVNADTVAGMVAEALDAHTLLLVTPSGGLRRKANDPTTLVSTFAAVDWDEAQPGGWITDGMRVKMSVAARAAASGIEDVFVLGPDDLVNRATATRVTP